MPTGDRQDHGHTCCGGIKQAGPHSRLGLPDVLYMLIHYSIAAFEVLERKLTAPEKEEVYNVFFRVGQRMKLKELLYDYDEWVISYAQHLSQ
jgi:hypothetical protein